MVSKNKPRRNERMILGANNEPRTIQVVRDRGYVCLVFKKKHKLSKTSHPHEFAEAFLPRNQTIYKNKEASFPFVNLTSWTNSKAMLANTGENGITYKDFTPFNADELRCHVGIYVLQGLSLSPRVEYKFNCQCDDPVNGNDYI